MIPFDFVITFPFPYGIDTLKYDKYNRRKKHRIHPSLNYKLKTFTNLIFVSLTARIIISSKI